jgi:hypothetical protein
LTTAAVANHAAWHKVMKGGRTSTVSVATGERPKLIQQLAWANIPGAKLKVTVPEGKHALLLMRFSAETTCYTNVLDYCSMRILVDDREGRPSAGRDFHIDSHYGDETEESQKGRAFARALEVGPGTHTVKVQGSTMNAQTLRVDDWHLTVEKVKT